MGMCVFVSVRLSELVGAAMRACVCCHGILVDASCECCCVYFIRHDINAVRSDVIALLGCHCIAVTSLTFFGLGPFLVVGVD